MNYLSETEINVLKCFCSGKVADFGHVEGMALNQEYAWRSERTIRASFIRWLCTDSEKINCLIPHGLRLRNARIEGQLDLSSINIPFDLFLLECFFSHTIDLRHSSLPTLNLSGSRTLNINADCLRVSGNVRLAKGFRAEGPVSFIGAAIKGNFSCVNGHFSNRMEERDTTKITDCGDCRTSKLHTYSLVIERARVEGSIYLCGGFTANGGVHLGDASIGMNLNCTKGEFSTYIKEPNEPGRSSGRRLTCETDAEHHLACAFNGEGMHVKGNLILNGVSIRGETRLTGAIIDGDLDSANGKYLNEGTNAIHGDRLRVRGNVYFCDDFESKGTVRLPRAEIGADLSFCKGSLSNSQKNLLTLYCEGIKIQGSLFLKKTKVNIGHVDISYSSIGGNLDCTDSSIICVGPWALKAKGMEIKGSVFLRSSVEGNFQALGMVGLTGSKLGMDLICTNAHFKAVNSCESEEDVIVAIWADNMTIGGKVEMDGKNFIADGGTSLDYTSIGSYLNCEHGTFKSFPLDKNKEVYAISAGKLQVGGSIYFTEGFNAEGEIMLNDAVIGRNFNCNNGKMEKLLNFSLKAMQMKITGSINMENFKSYGEVRIDYSIIGGNLSCGGSDFINTLEGNPNQKSADQEGKCYAFHANEVKIIGFAKFKDNFHADGIVSLQGTEIGRALIWKNIREAHKASLFLDSAKVGVLEDDASSWPSKNNLQINGFEYLFLKEMTPEGFKKRRERWLNLSKEFRTQPFEHLAVVLKRSGYEEEAKEVLIQKNISQTNLPVRWPWRNERKEKDPLEIGLQQSQSPMTWILRKIFEALVCYGYKPIKALRYGLIFLIFGWIVFSLGFNYHLMTPTKDLRKGIYQVATINSDSNDTKTGTITEGSFFYSFLYSLDTFLPIIDFQAAEYWLPTAYPPTEPNPNLGGLLLCIYRWIHIVSGWVITSFFIAALSGIVRK